MRRVRRDRDNPLNWVMLVVMAVTLSAIEELVRRFTSLPETTALVVSGGLRVLLTCLPVWLAGRLMTQDSSDVVLRNAVDH